MIAVLSGHSGAISPVRARVKARQFGGQAFAVNDVPIYNGGQLNYAIAPWLNTRRGVVSLLMPDGSYGGGNARGAFRCLDLNLSCSASFPEYIINGNHAGGGGLAMKVTGQYAFGWGTFCQVTGDYAVGFGNSNATGGSSVSFGSATASGSNSFAHGFLPTASGNYSFATGLYGTAPYYGQMTRCSGYLVANGDCQRSWLQGGRRTTDATPTELRLDLDTNTARIGIPANSSHLVTISIVARTNTAGGGVASFTRQFLISRGVAAGTTAILGTVDTIGTDKGSNAGAPPAGWAVAITADTANGAAAVTVTGAAATQINWSCAIDRAESVYA